ncbi:MgtC/SapB family protein [Turneriella parva]|uniref:Transmembrane protein n=1 Tax=Turneriella parva (strain ATCC BAA-1111 / DSM 21527 / NCTC 11395 / H) TaxID=869212 RepID=I4B6J5_TURPD|nr:MgtC/SapB family protein [Turneriella parva]AFM12902.1 transmembrane protein [Turneriella parva DSM 21527]
MLDQVHPFALSLMTGLAIGIEREHHHRNSHDPLGVRTFALLALAGTVCAFLAIDWLTGAVAAALFVLIALSYWRSSGGSGAARDTGLTTEVAAIVVYCTGYIFYRDTAIGLATGLSTLALLISRDTLHKFAREKLQRSELQAAAILLIAMFGVVPFLPNHAVDPFGVMNPRQLVTLLSLIGILQFVGYATRRIFGARAGLALSGFLGGIVSSTAVFLGLRDVMQANKNSERAVMASALFANAASLTELAAVLAMGSINLLTAIAVPLAVLIGLNLAIAALLFTRRSDVSPESEPGKPLSVMSVLKLGLLVFSLVALVNLAHRTLQNTGLWLVAFLSGLFELQGVSLAIALDLSRGTVDIASARTAVLVAIAAASMSKVGILLVRHRNRFGLILSLILCATVAAALATAGFTAA